MQSGSQNCRFISRGEERIAAAVFMHGSVVDKDKFDATVVCALFNLTMNKLQSAKVSKKLHNFTINDERRMNKVLVMNKYNCLKINIYVYFF